MSDFWSKRRAAVEAEEAEALAEVKEAELEAATAEKTDAEILEDLGLPDPDQMEQGDDFSAFMNDLVPARIKTRALRKLWRLNPVLANIDGLVDYGEDFTDAAMVIENMQTTYQVGKGMMAHVKEMARQALEAEEETAPEEITENEDLLHTDEAEDINDSATAADTGSVSEAEPIIVNAPEEDQILPNASRRRMQFQFEDQPTG